MVQDEAKPFTSLDQARTRIDQIDTQILEFLDERMQISLNIAEIKKQNKKDIYDPNREKELLEKLKKNNISKILSPQDIETIWKEIIQISVTKQNQT